MIKKICNISYIFIKLIFLSLFGLFSRVYRLIKSFIIKEETDYFLTKQYAPVYTEYIDQELDTTGIEIPECLEGSYIRNGPVNKIFFNVLQRIHNLNLWDIITGLTETECYIK
jgi:hypothetical protein